MSNSEEIANMVNKHCSELMEHVDTVQILVTWHSGGEEVTRSYETGKGSIYARQGQVDEWLRIQHQYARNWAARKDEEE